jgi:hypothetical protein
LAFKASHKNGCCRGLELDFTRHSLSGSKGTAKGNRGIANAHVYSDNYDKWKKLIPNLHARSLLLRAYVLNSEDIWAGAGRGVNVLATDKVRIRPSWLLEFGSAKPGC